MARALRSRPGLTLALKAARAWQVRPSEYLGWSGLDRGLAEGLIEAESSVGPHGIPWVDALDPENDGWFEVREQIDYAQRPLDEWQKENQGSEAEPGARVYVVDLRREGGD